MTKLCPSDAGLDESSNSAHPNGVRGAVPLVSISAMYSVQSAARISCSAGGVTFPALSMYDLCFLQCMHEVSQLAGSKC